MRVYERFGRWFVECSYNGKRYRRSAGRSKRDALLKLGKIVERIKAEDKDGTPALAPRSFSVYTQEYLNLSRAEKRPLQTFSGRAIRLHHS